MDRVLLGSFGEQPQGQVLPADRGGQEAIGGAIVAMGRNRGRDRPHHEACAGEAIVNWRDIFGSKRADAEQDAELKSYLAIATETNIARGMSREEARRAALRKLGNATR